MGRVYSRATVSVEGKLLLPFQAKKIYSLCIMQETKKIAVGLDVKLNKSDILYHCIISFINLRQG